MVAIVAHPIDLASVESHVQDPGHGALLTFSGVARNTFGGREVRALHYETWEAMALKELARIESEVIRLWPTVRVAMVHRTGDVPIGEASVVVAVGAPHRAEAYEASRHAIDTLKKSVPIWKKEIYADGETWVANRP